MRTVAIGSGPVAPDHVGCGQRHVGRFRRREGKNAFSLEPVEGDFIRPFRVAPDEVADLFADIPIGSVLSHVCGPNVVQCAADAHGQAQVEQ